MLLFFKSEISFCPPPTHTPAPVHRTRTEARKVMQHVLLYVVHENSLTVSSQPRGKGRGLASIQGFPCLSWQPCLATGNSLFIFFSHWHRTCRARISCCRIFPAQFYLPLPLQ